METVNDIIRFIPWGIVSMLGFGYYRLGIQVAKLEERIAALQRELSQHLKDGRIKMEKNKMTKYDYASILFSGKCNARCPTCIGNYPEFKGTPQNLDVRQLRGLEGFLDKIKEENLEAHIIHTVHDEIVVETEESIADQVREIVASEMVRAAKKRLKKVPVEVDAKISSVWEHQGQLEFVN